MIGETVSHYRITAKIGQGGMGEVYRAEDTTLKREVAIKVLPEAFTADAERLERFKAEARVLASLNHPGIAQIFGLEAVDGRNLLVMELVDGRDLSERLGGGAIPVAEVISIGRQIAAALEAAHERGIVHRDLKPANIKLGGDGTVKVLDFGLAKAGADAAPVSDHSPTLTARGLTEPGVILGTAAYMSPEQARGVAVDRRADIWSFGVVLWEMLTGRRLFTGDTVSDVLAGVLRDEPDLDALPADTPPHLRRLVERCLRRDPKSRLQWIGDARLELEEGPVGVVESDQGEGAPGSPRPVAAWMAAVAGLAAGVLVAVGLMSWSEAGPSDQVPKSSPQPRLVADLTPPEGYAFSAVDGGPELSPDGRRLAFLAARPGEPVYLFLRSLDGPQARRVDVPGAMLPFFSPDGRSVAFFAGGMLKRLDIASWHVVDLAAAPAPAGGDWSTDGRILFLPDLGRPPVIVGEDGGEPRQLPEAFPKLFEPYYFWCELLPDGRHYLFTLQDLAGPHSGIHVASLDGGETPKKLTRTVSRPRFLEPGWLLFSTGALLEAWPFDSQTLTMGDQPVRLVDGVAWGRFYSHGRFAVSETGLLVYHPGEGVAGDTELVTTDRSGRVLDVPGELAEYYAPRLSHDGRRIAVDMTDVQTTHGDIWVLDPERGTRTRLSSSAFDESDPVWLPADGEIVYHSGPDLFRREASAATAEQKLVASEASKEPEDVTPDGRQLLFLVNTEAGYDLWLLDLESGEARPWLDDESYDEKNGRFSPDGRWVAYETDEGGSPEIVLRSFPEGRERIAVSPAGGHTPVWRADGSELFYLSPGSEMMAVPVAWTAGRPRPGAPETLFPIRLRGGEGDFDIEYDVYPDGQNLLLNRVVVESDEGAMVLILGWDAALRGVR